MPLPKKIYTLILGQFFILSFIHMSRTSLLSLLLALSFMMANARPGLLVVLYSYPTDNGGAIWSSIKTTKINNPELPVMAIANPDSGPGTSQDSDYVTAINDLVAVGITVIGYVDTDYATVPIATVKANMDLYKDWYSGVTGFFLDQMKNVAGSESYYTEATAHAVSIGLGYTMGNPGTASIQSYFNTVNNSVIYEHHPLPAASVLNLGYPIEMCTLIAYDVPASVVNQSYINDVSQYVNWIWLTDDQEPNPYDSNPTYLSTLVSYIVNAGSSTPTTTPAPSASGNSLTTSISTIFVIIACLCAFI
jgi:hypothetical protein